MWTPLIYWGRLASFKAKIETLGFIPFFKKIKSKYSRVSFEKRHLSKFNVEPFSESLWKLFAKSGHVQQ